MLQTYGLSYDEIATSHPPLTLTLSHKVRGINSLISLWKYILIHNTYPVMAGIKDFLRNHHLIGNQINA
jgi:hypothetical protein